MKELLLDFAVSFNVEIFNFFRMIANSFAVSYIYTKLDVFNVYPFTKKNSKLRGTKQEYQRFEVCIDTIEWFMQPALLALSAQKYFDKETRKAATALVKEAVADVTNLIKTTNELDEHEDVRKKLVEELKTMKLSIMYPNEIIDQMKIEEMYEEMQVDGSEPLIEIRVSMVKNYFKLLVESDSSWMKRVERFVKEVLVKYFEDDNTLGKMKVTNFVGFGFFKFLF